MGDSGITNGSTASSVPEEVLQKYARERDKRLRADGDAQFVDIPGSEKLARYDKDPWEAEFLELQRTHGVRPRVEDGTHTKVFILGAGFAGLVFAVKLLQAGFTIDDLLIVDTAGGFGGTWYWNRYPGLMCDVESYIYMPLLEETGYMPKHKYAQGTELRNYANMMAEKWGLHRAAVFKTLAKEMKWNDDKKSWEVQTIQKSGNNEEHAATVTADFVILGTGLFSNPKMPNLPGIEDFQGHTFHTSRWDYEYTGGSPEDPSLIKLKDKKVGIIGTGATAIQAVPELAKWAKELYVFQRTPSSVDRRDNRETDPEWWAREVLSRGKGWQRKRMENYNAFISNCTPPPEEDLVNDGWTELTSYCALIGGPNNSKPDFLSTVHQLDYPRQERIRARVDSIVKDKETADRLKAWYPGWCKRPCFHDEYLQAFNEPHVKLVDTDGKGVSRLTKNGVVVGDNDEYDLDVVVFSTGFNLHPRSSPAARGRLTITGRAGLDMEHKWTVKGVGTLHGIVSRDFPNLFYPPVHQGAVGPNYSYCIEISSTHIAYIISETVKRAAHVRGHKVTVEPTAEAEQEWTMEILKRAGALIGAANCTPSYYNNEGALSRRDMSMEEQIALARGSSWGEGVASYTKVIEEWRAKGDMEGLEVRCSVPATA
ncbi:hypothetical protein VTO42DRAFT_5387 [Malbranchea cinnamomea]